MPRQTTGEERVEYGPLMKDTPMGERPRERLENYGPGALSNAELLAIILRTGVGGESVVAVAQRVLAKYGGLAGLAQATIGELCREYGIGKAKAITLKAAFELGRRLLATAPEERPQIRSPADAANLLMADMSLLTQEHLCVLLLDSKHRVLRRHEVYVGNVNTSVVRIGELFREAVRDNCAALLVAHNHPSGDPTPSPEDVAVTEQMIEAGKLLGIDMLDHLVIGNQRYVSLKERGLAFDQGGKISHAH